MRAFYDFEFLEHQVSYRPFPFGQRRRVWTVEPLSIGVKIEDGREYYAVVEDAPWDLVRKNEWLMENVVPSLPRLAGDQRNHAPQSWLFNMRAREVKPLKVIAEEAAGLLQSVPKLQLWADYSAFDHVSLMWLLGRMMDKPEGIPMFTHDLQQRVRQLGNPQLSRQDYGEHNALEDARQLERRSFELDRLEKHLGAFEL